MQLFVIHQNIERKMQSEVERNRVKWCDL